MLPHRVGRRDADRFRLRWPTSPQVGKRDADRFRLRWPTSPQVGRRDASPQGGEARSLSWAALQQLGERAFELGEAFVHLDHLIGADGVVRINVGLVLCPLRAAVTAVEKEAIGVGAVDVDRRVFRAPSTGTFALVWFQL